jgi:hypothetical protein
MAVRFSDFIAARSAGTIDGSDVVAIKAGATVRVDGDTVVKTSDVGTMAAEDATDYDDRTAADARYYTRADEVFAPRTALRLPGTSGNYVSTPDSASLDITGNLTLVAYVAPDTWTPAGTQMFVAKYGTAGQRSHRFGLVNTGHLTATVSSDGTATTTQNSSAVVSAAAGEARWVAVTFVADNGSGSRVWRFWTSSDGATWTQLGTTATISGTWTTFASTAPVEVGSIETGNATLLSGKVYRAQVRNGVGTSGTVGGTVVADWRGDAPLGPRYTDSTGKVWTINGSAWSWVVA